MRFSVIAGPRQRPDLKQSAADAWWNYVNDAVLADKLGFDSAFIGEHHFCFASGDSSPFVMLAHIAARTERIRVGTSVICMPFHNPLRVAEDIAAVDIVSKGRFDFGVGVGSSLRSLKLSASLLRSASAEPGRRSTLSSAACMGAKRCFRTKASISTSRMCVGSFRPTRSGYRSSGVALGRKGCSGPRSAGTI